MSLDPYMRGRMSDAKSYARPVGIGEVMQAGTVGEVVRSRNPNFREGDTVQLYGGWQDYALSSGAGARKIDPAAAPIQSALGILGMPGMTAYCGFSRSASRRRARPSPFRPPRARSARSWGRSRN